MPDIDEQIKIMEKGAVEIINTDELKGKLNKLQPLTVKLGLDPSAPDIHLGHAVVLRKVRQLQDLGHKAVIIIGDFTGMIGDPTGKSKTRKPMERNEILENAKTYEMQVFKIIDKEKTTVRFNSEWLEKLNFKEVMNLASKHTVARMLEREDFKNRFVNNESIGIHEFFYPLMQGYDSVEINADIEIGGTEQKFNILMGRTLQNSFNMEKQIAIFMPLLEGIDGVEKMSKSLGNYIAISEEPSVMYQKVMKIPDRLIIKYYELATDIHPDDVKKISEKLKDEITNPRDIKMNLAFEITRLYHGTDAAEQAKADFITVFQKKELPDEIPAYNLKKDEGIINVLVGGNLAKSNSEARRLVSQGAIRINGNPTNDITIPLKNDDVIQAGKKSFIRIIRNN